jgi:hypothetical protein
MPLPAAAVVGGLFTIGEKLIDKFFPDPEEAARKKLEMAQLIQSGELKELETRMSAILAEANSSDPWTSRARPSFLYVVYIILLASIPMGIVYAVSPELAQNITAGYKAWLAAIPEEMWTLFGVGYLGYAGARSWDKRNQVKKE